MTLQICALPTSTQSDMDFPPPGKIFLKWSATWVSQTDQLLYTCKQMPQGLWVDEKNSRLCWDETLLSELCCSLKWVCGRLFLISLIVQRSHCHTSKLLFSWRSQLALVLKVFPQRLVQG